MWSASYGFCHIWGGANKIFIVDFYYRKRGLAEFDIDGCAQHMDILINFQLFRPFLVGNVWGEGLSSEARAILAIIYGEDRGSNEFYRKITGSGRAIYRARTSSFGFVTYYFSLMRDVYQSWVSLQYTCYLRTGRSKISVGAKQGQHFSMQAPHRRKVWHQIEKMRKSLLQSRFTFFLVSARSGLRVRIQRHSKKLCWVLKESFEYTVNIQSFVFHKMLTLKSNLHQVSIFFFFFLFFLFRRRIRKSFLVNK